MKKYIKLWVAAFAAILTIAVVQPVNAEEAVYTVDVAGYYRSPADGQIEDSGGETQYALGQSMVEGVVETTGLLEQTSDGGYALYVRFNLMDNISDVGFMTMKSDGSSWSSVTYQTTGSTEDTTDFYIPLPAKESYVRAECYVEPMGRSVIFYLGYDNLVSGNNTDIKLYTGSTSSSSSSSTTTSSSSSSDDASESVTTSGNGLTIGYADSSESDDDEASEDEEETAIGVIDDSVWITLFGVVFIAVFLAGLVLIFVVILVQKIQRNHDEIRQKNIKKLERFESEEVFNDEIDFSEMDE